MEKMRKETLPCELLQTMFVPLPSITDGSYHRMRKQDMYCRILRRTGQVMDILSSTDMKDLCINYCLFIEVMGDYILN